MKVKDIMTNKVISVNINAPVSKVVREMVSNDISGVVVVDNAGDMVGVISAIDIFKLLNEASESWNFVAEDIMTPLHHKHNPRHGHRRGGEDDARKQHSQVDRDLLPH
jgi:CBS domain-containing protein